MLRLDMNLVFTIINLLILFLLLKKFLFGPVVSVMEKRKALIEEQLANAANTQAEADKMKAEYEETFKNADSQAADIISEAKKNAKAEYDKIVEDAHTQAGRIVENAEKNMEVQKEKEGELICKAFQPGDVIVLLDEGGKEMRSIEFADYMKRKMNTVNKRLVFVIGGPYGFSPKVYQAAHEKMSLSKMTFSHQMVRLIFVEQLYRAMNILNGGPYHHE